MAPLRLPSGSGPGAPQPTRRWEGAGLVGSGCGEAGGRGALRAAPDRGTGRDGRDGRGQAHLGSDR